MLAISLNTNATRDMAQNKPTLLVANCPRCNSENMTFDVTAHVFRRREYRWQTWHEVFSVCRRCHRPTTFIIALSVDRYHTEIGEALSSDAAKLLQFEMTLNDVFDVKGFVSVKDNDGRMAPEHTPADVASCFNEGTRCRAIGCFNAAATMFRLSLDLATRPLLPSRDAGMPQPKRRERRDLGPRIEWLLQHHRLPSELATLADCIREDGNDGAHSGRLGEADADDLMDFTEALFERLYTEPEKLRIAAERRLKRRAGSAA